MVAELVGVASYVTDCTSSTGCTEEAKRESRRRDATVQSLSGGSERQTDGAAL